MVIVHSKTGVVKLNFRLCVIYHLGIFTLWGHKPPLPLPHKKPTTKNPKHSFPLWRVCSFSLLFSWVQFGSFYYKAAMWSCYTCTCPLVESVGPGCSALCPVWGCLEMYQWGFCSYCFIVLFESDMWLTQSHGFHCQEGRGWKRTWTEQQLLDAVI